MRNASKKMKWNIGEKEFKRIVASPSLTNSDLEQGFAGIVLFYGFGDDSTGLFLIKKEAHYSITVSITVLQLYVFMLRC